MKFGVREICDVVFKAKDAGKIGTMQVTAGQPVLYIDSATTSTVEGAATTVYAQGGRGNTRLLAWEGEKTLTFTVEDALLSPIGFSILSGAGLIDYNANGKSVSKVNVHTTSTASVAAGSTTIDLSSALYIGEESGVAKSDKICTTAPIFVAVYKDGSITETVKVSNVSADGTITLEAAPTEVTSYFVDYYVEKEAETVSELQIDAENFAGYYYVEASTLFRKESTGKDLPAELTIPKVKIQSNFTFNMASTGDPSTFTFTMDAFPDYTYFNRNRKVLMAMQIIDESKSASANMESVFPCEVTKGEETIEETVLNSDGEAINDSFPSA